MIILIRTNSSNYDFCPLTEQLNTELIERYGDLQKEYSKHNKTEGIDTVVIAYYAETAAGCGCFKMIDNETVEIKRMFVKSEFRGQGISKQILAELEKWASEKGFTRAVLETGNKQHEAIGLYTRMGYSRIANYGPYADMENSICMAKLFNFTLTDNKNNPFLP